MQAEHDHDAGDQCREGGIEGDPQPERDAGDVPAQRTLGLLQGAADAAHRAHEPDGRDRPRGEAHHRQLRVQAVEFVLALGAHRLRGVLHAACRSEAVQRHHQRSRQQHLLFLARQAFDRSTVGARVIGQHHVPFAELDVGLVKQAPVTGDRGRLVRDQRQRPGRQDQRHLLLVVFQDHVRGAQVVGHRLSGFQLVLRDRGLGEDRRGARADHRGVERLYEDHAHQERCQAEQGIAANRAHELISCKRAAGAHALRPACRQAPAESAGKC